MSYQRLRESDDNFVSLCGNNISTEYNPSYSMFGLSAGVVLGQAEASVEWFKGNWNLGTSRQSHDGLLDTPDQKTNYMEDGASSQSTVYFVANSRSRWIRRSRVYR